MRGVEDFRFGIDLREINHVAGTTFENLGQKASFCLDTLLPNSTF